MAAEEKATEHTTGDQASSSEPGLPTTWSRISTFIGAVVVGLVAVAGLWLIVWPAYTTARAGATNSEQASCMPIAPPCSVTQETTIASDGRKSSKTTVAPVPFQDRLLAGLATPLLELVLVLLAAFLAGGVVQRTLRGHFGITVGPLSLPEIAGAASTAASSLGTRTRKLKRAVDGLRESNKKTSESIDSLAKLAAGTQEYLVELGDWAQRAEKALEEKGINIPDPDSKP